MAAVRPRQVNTFSPLRVSANPRGRSQIPNLTRDGTVTGSQNFSTLVRNQAFDRLDAGVVSQANPDFTTGAAGRILGTLTEGNAGNPPQISRGYIRRTVLDNGDPTSPYRLYFMYNPESIQRTYVSYLDQQALDPFNTVFGSNNLVAPPGVLDFQFSLFFDRQTENANGSMPRGVLEDFDFFDLVVRGVVPGNQTSLPDNGIMMINPRNITVVFSPQLSVQGRPNSATVSYDKFDHLMRPVRMTITIGMKVFYIGSVVPDFTFAQSKVQGDVSATIPYDESTFLGNITSETLKAATFTAVNPPAPLSAAGQFVASINNVVSGPNAAVREGALVYAESNLGENRYPYAQTRPVPDDPNLGLDCSGVVFWAYRRIGALALLGFDTPFMNGNTIRDAARQKNTIVAEGSTFGDAFFSNGLQRGDIFVGDQHVAWCAGVDPANGTIRTYESANYGLGPEHFVFPYAQIYGPPNNHQCAIRPAVGTL